MNLKQRRLKAKSFLLTLIMLAVLSPAAVLPAGALDNVAWDSYYEETINIENDTAYETISVYDSGSVTVTINAGKTLTAGEIKLGMASINVRGSGSMKVKGNVNSYFDGESGYAIAALDLYDNTTTTVEGTVEANVRLRGGTFTASSYAGSVEIFHPYYYETGSGAVLLELGRYVSHELYDDEKAAIAGKTLKPAVASVTVGETTTYFSTLPEATAAAAEGSTAQSPGKVTLLANVTTSDTLTIAADTFVTLDLAGHTIDRGLKGKAAADDGSVITVNGSLTLTDSSKDKTGAITGGSSEYGGGVYVKTTDEEHPASFTVSGGSITGNTANSGGGVYVENSAAFTMSGGSITGNNASYGGGVGVNSGSVLSLSGAPVIKDNFKSGRLDEEKGVYVGGENSNLYFYLGQDGTAVATVTGKLTDGAHIGVLLEKLGVFAQAKTGKLTDSDRACFVSDNDRYDVALNADGKVYLGIPFKNVLIEVDEPTYNGSALTPTVTVEVGGGTLCKDTDYTVSYSDNVNAGYDSATVTVTGIGNYTGTASKKFSIAPASVTVTADDKSKEYGDDDPELTATVDGTFGTDKVSYTLSREEGENVGTYAITLSGETDQGNYEVSFVEGDFTINRKSGTVTVSLPTDTEYVYNRGEHTPTVTVMLGETELDKGTDYTVSYDNNTDAGTATVTVSQASDGNYSFAAVSTDFIIERASVTVTADDKSKTYGDDDPELTATVDGTFGDDKVSYTLSRDQGESVGTYAITLAGETDQGNYDVSFVDGTFTISTNSGAVTVLLPTDTKYVYNGKEHTPEVTVMLGKVELEEGADYTVSYSDNTDAGTAKITVSPVKDGNCSFTAAEVTFTIDPASVTVTAENKSKALGAKDPELTAAVSGLIGEDKVVYELSRAKGEDAATYAITPAGDKEQGNYSVSYVEGTLTIERATATVVHSGWNKETNTFAAKVIAPDGGLLIVAVYDGDGRLVNVDTREAEASATKVQIFDTEFKKTSGYTYKLMLVDEGFVPLYEARVQTVE